MAYNASPIALASLPAPATPTLAPAPLLGVQIGPDTSGSFAMSVSGLAVQRSDGRWVAKPRGQAVLVDVTDGLLAGMSPMASYLPTPYLKPDDLAVISNAGPLALRHVLEVREDGELEVLDPDTGDVNRFVPLQTPLLNCFVRVVSIYDLFPDMNFLELMTEAHRVQGDPASFFREHGKREMHMGEPRERERFEMDETLMALLMTTLANPTQGPQSIAALLPLFMFSRMGGREGGLLAMLAICGLMPQVAATTTSTTTAPASTTTPAPTANAALPLLLAMAMSGGFGRPWRERDHYNEEGPRDKPEPYVKP